jgi:hypothetical protein
LVGAETYWTAELRREQLLDVLQDRGPRPTVVASDSWSFEPKPNRIIGVWRGSDQSELPPLPQVIIGDRRTLDDLIAWSITYLRGLGALTSQTRTLTPNEFYRAQSRKRISNWRGIASGAVGLIIGEALLHTRRAKAPDTVNLIACRSTLSYVLMRATAIGAKLDELYGLAEDWERLRANMRQTATISARTIAEVASALVRSKSQSNADIADGNAAQHWLFLLLTSSQTTHSIDEIDRSFDLSTRGIDLHNIREKTAEDRVLLFDKAAPIILEQATRREPEKAFALAFIAFLSRPGFPQQALLLSSIESKLPESLLWLGAMQSLVPTEETLAFGEGLGWRLARDIFLSYDLFDFPTSDIALSELQVLWRANSLTRALKFLPRSRLEVELLPGISTWVRSVLTEVTEQPELPMTVPGHSPESSEVESTDLLEAQKWLELALDKIRRAQTSSPVQSRGSRRKRR